MGKERLGNKWEMVAYLAKWRSLLGVLSHEEVSMVDLAERVVAMERGAFLTDQSRRKNKRVALEYLGEHGSQKSVPALLYAWSAYWGQDGDKLNGDKLILGEVEKQLWVCLPGMSGQKLMELAEDRQVNWLGWVAYRMGYLPEGEKVNAGCLERVLAEVRRELGMMAAAEIESMLTTG